jgi:hypothetical protein
VGRGLSLAPEGDFRHTSSSLTVALGDPVHAGEDAIVASDRAPTLAARFGYGLVADDLEDEDVRVWFDDCRGFRELGDFATDDEGRISVPLSERFGPGVYEARFQVLGDRSTTSAYVWVLPRETRVIVTDIDGTLTASDSELFLQILDGSHVPVAYPGAVELTNAHADLGWVVVYLTGRPYWLTERTRVWTDDLRFAPGPLHVAPSNEEALPGESGVGAFKLGWLSELLERGYRVDFAYGNASTDLYAYLGAGLDPSTVWIIGDHAGEMETQPATDSWEPRVSEVEALSAVSQPFVWPVR